MAYLPAVLGTPLKGRVLERLLRRGAGTVTELAADLDATRQQITKVVAELAFLGVVREQPGEDRRTTVVSIDEEHPFVEPLRVLAMDGGTWYETPEAWQVLLARRYGRDWYVGGYAAVRRVMQPIDFEAPNVLANVRVEDGKLDIASALQRASQIQLQVRRIDHIPPEVVPTRARGVDVWFATPERGFVEAWKLKEVPLYGLMLCFVQGLHDAVLDPVKLLKVAPAERMEGEVRTLLATARERLPLRELVRPVKAVRALKANEKEAFEQALNTVVG